MAVRDEHALRHCQALVLGPTSMAAVHVVLYSTFSAEASVRGVESSFLPFDWLMGPYGEVVPMRNQCSHCRDMQIHFSQIHNPPSKNASAGRLGATHTTKQRVRKHHTTH